MGLTSPSVAPIDPLISSAEKLQSTEQDETVLITLWNVQQKKCKMCECQRNNTDNRLSPQETCERMLNKRKGVERCGKLLTCGCKMH